eukprot:Rmarinus@m.8623
MWRAIKVHHRKEAASLGVYRVFRAVKDRDGTLPFTRTLRRCLTIHTKPTPFSSSVVVVVVVVVTAVVLLHLSCCQRQRRYSSLRAHSQAPDDSYHTHEERKGESPSCMFSAPVCGYITILWFIYIYIYIYI